jgi:signal transduction histidine kinase
MVFSLNDLISKSDEFFEHNYLKIKFGETFKYVQIKIKTIIHKGRDDVKLIQLVDISDKILYTEVKAEHTFLEMINAAVSHELRNPLNALIGQVCAMKQFFANFKKVIKEMKKSESSQFVTKL